MSLAGSLDDLGLGELLQVLGLTAKSGLLTLQTSRGEGWILLDAGRVRAASAKGEPSDLAGLLSAAGALDREIVRRAAHGAAASGRGLEQVLAEEHGLAPERLEELRRGAAEAAVVRMFAWTRGAFRFEPGRGAEAALRLGLAVERPLPSEYLAIEGMRLLDEAARGEAPWDDGPSDRAGPGDRGGEARAAGGEALRERVAGETAHRPLVAIDPELPALEWLKDSLKGAFLPVHILQSTELGLSRIRQYLARGTVPLVLLSTACHPDALSGARGAVELWRRLAVQAPRMPVVLLESEDTLAPGPGSGPEGAGESGTDPDEDGQDEPARVAPTVSRPSLEELRSPGARARVNAAARALRARLLELAGDA